MPFFFDPDFNAALEPIPGVGSEISRRRTKIELWDGVEVHRVTGTYGDYLLSKVSRVFPDLGRQHLSR